MRSCLECGKFHFWSGEPAYSEVTPGSDPQFLCDATPSHWAIDLFDDTTRTLRQKLLMAETCPDFVEEKP